MSIYPVRVKEWFPPGDPKHQLVKWIVSSGYTDTGVGCINCKKIHMHWQEAYVHHSLASGYGDIWCRKKCYDNFWKKKK